MEQKALIIGEETVRKYLNVDDVIDICEKTWRWYGEGKVVMLTFGKRLYCILA